MEYCIESESDDMEWHSVAVVQLESDVYMMVYEISDIVYDVRFCCIVLNARTR